MALDVAHTSNLQLPKNLGSSADTEIANVATISQTRSQESPSQSNDSLQILGKMLFRRYSAGNSTPSSTHSYNQNEKQTEAFRPRFRPISRRYSCM